ncbi:outer membrane protein assembly factor BamC [Marinobacter sp. HL-58]|uniref:outer membrane protein assembly factor BamC n=1 Tax=Marinobacter sp. HL-58 TaxID=1479237 RepID=UPI000481A6A4|nr:outer membrane protein assembly factor BamC [Marinobacter sp. HL-58]KPP98845.1 MAG: beta barrel protein translocation lipoprotein component BamC [Marinobacter sp. HL-58]
MAFTFRTESKKSVSFIRPLPGLMLVLAITGCSVIDDRSERYVDEPEGKPLKLPETADEGKFSQVMPIREISSADSGRMYRDSIPNPPDMTSDILDENYVVEELDGQVWLLVNDVPGRLWPAVTAYMNENGLGVAYDSPQLGLIQSELVNFSKQARELLNLPDNPEGEEARLVVQARIAPGVRRKTSEIQFRTFEVDSDPDELLAWGSGEERSAEQLDTSKRLLDDLAGHLRNREDSKSYSRAALGMVSEPLVRLVSDNEIPRQIEMSLDYGRAWAEVSRALDEAGVPVVDLNRDEGYFFVDFRPESERESGWFSWFSSDPEPEHTFDVQLGEDDGNIVVTVERADDYDGEDRSPELLSELFEYLY